MAEPKVYDKSGELQTWAWLTQHYGPVEIVEQGKYKVVEVREATGYATIIVTIRGKSGNPVPNVKVAWYWPDADIHPDAGHLGRCDIGFTNGNGQVGFPMGRGAYYYPPNKGPHGIWVYGGDSDAVLGLGMIIQTEHDHLDIVLQEKDSEEPPPPPDDDKVQKILALLDDTIDALLEAVEILETMR